MPNRLPLGRSFLAILPLALLLPGCSTPASRPPKAELPSLTAPARPAGADVLPLWRSHFGALAEALRAIETPLITYESADSPPVDLTTEQLAPIAAAIAPFTLTDGQVLVFPPIHGPETPFPDHHPLREIATVRTVLARRAIADGNIAEALNLVRQNLRQARATLTGIEGIIPLIHSSGVWQCALDGAHALARSPLLSAEDARALLRELENDRGLAPVAIDRALRGEYLDVYCVIVDRMPKTDDPDLMLSSVGSLGMAEPTPLQPGEIGLGVTEHPLLDRDATLAAYEADLEAYLATLATSTRFPRGIFARVTAPKLAEYHRQLGRFFEYASGDGETTLELIVRARADLEATPNPIGKLLAIYLTPPWEVLMASVYRREAQRAAVCGLLAWRIHGSPTSWDELVAKGILSAPPADPFSDGTLLHEPKDSPRIWSVHLDGTNGGGVPVEGNSGQPDDLVWLW